MSSQNQITTKGFFERESVKKRLNEMLGARTPQFITSVLQIVSQNSMLVNADPASVYHAACVAATLNLPLNNNLGFAYIVPYNERQQDGTTKVVAQFQMGYKGFIQLAQRSGQFKTISATPIYEGQIVEINPLTGFKFDFTKQSDKVIGYASYFELINGFSKLHYMSIEQLKAHGARYSKTFNHKNGRWTVDFDAMASKTVLKLLLSKFAPLSIEMEKATLLDQSIVYNDQGDNFKYVDNGNESETMSDEDKENERIALLINDATQISDLEILLPHVSESNQIIYEEKLKHLIDESKNKK